MGQALIDRKFGKRAKGEEVKFQDGSTVYVLTEDDDEMALNAGHTDCEPRPGWLVIFGLLGDLQFLFSWRAWRNDSKSDPGDLQ